MHSVPQASVTHTEVLSGGAFVSPWCQAQCERADRPSPRLLPGGIGDGRAEPLPPPGPEASRSSVVRTTPLRSRSAKRNNSSWMALRLCSAPPNSTTKTQLKAPEIGTGKRVVSPRLIHQLAAASSNATEGVFAPTGLEEVLCGGKLQASSSTCPRR